MSERTLAGDSQNPARIENGAPNSIIGLRNSIRRYLTDGMSLVRLGRRNQELHWWSSELDRRSSELDRRRSELNRWSSELNRWRSELNRRRSESQSMGVRAQ